MVFSENINFKSTFLGKLNSVDRIPALRLITKNNLGMHQSSQTWIPGPCRQLAGLMGLVNVNVGVVLLVYEMNYYVQADWVEIKKSYCQGLVIRPISLLKESLYLIGNPTTHSLQHSKH